jgi:hypothetical protein
MLNSVGSRDSSLPDEKLRQQINLIRLRSFTLISPVPGNLESHNTLIGTHLTIPHLQRESSNINIMNPYMISTKSTDNEKLQRIK